MTRYGIRYSTPFFSPPTHSVENGSSSKENFLGKTIKTSSNFILFDRFISTNLSTTYLLVLNFYKYLGLLRGSSFKILTSLFINGKTILTRLYSGKKVNPSQLHNLDSVVIT